MALKDSQTAKLYLFLYNLIQFCGWSYGLVLVVLHVSSVGNFTGVYAVVKTSVSIFQTLQMIEVLHCIVRLVPSNAFQTFVQVLSRLMVVWGILEPVVEARHCIGVPLLLTAWSIAEMTRYLYYALNIYDMVPYVLTWMRYTLFIVLYPVGVSGELITIVSAMPYIRDRNLYTIPMPNFANWSFYYNYFLVIVILAYIPFFPQLYFYMIAQRKKILGAPVSPCHKVK